MNCYQHSTQHDIPSARGAVNVPFNPTHHSHTPPQPIRSLLMVVHSSTENLASLGFRAFGHFVPEDLARCSLAVLRTRLPAHATEC